MSVPANTTLIGGFAQGDLHKRHSAFHETPGQQASLTKIVASVGITQFLGLFIQLERLRGFRTHHLNGLLIRVAVRLRNESRVVGLKIRLQTVQQFKPRLKLLDGDTRGQIQVFDGQLFRRRLHGTNRTTSGPHGQRSILRPQESRTKRRGTEEPLRSNAHEVRHLGIVTAQLFAQRRTQRGILHGSLRQVTRSEQVGRPPVVPLFGAHRPHQAEVLQLLSQLGQMFADLDPGDGGVDRLELAAILVAGLQIERIELTRSARHPQQNDRTTPVGTLFQVVRQQRKPAGGRCAEEPQAGVFEPISARDG